MDAGSIFVLVLTALFVAFIVFLGVISRRNARAEALKTREQEAAQTDFYRDKNQRKAA
jgi:preprotein translocase subunit SecG